MSVRKSEMWMYPWRGCWLLLGKRRRAISAWMIAGIAYRRFTSERDGFGRKRVQCGSGEAGSVCILPPGVFLPLIFVHKVIHL